MKNKLSVLSFISCERQLGPSDPTPVSTKMRRESKSGGRDMKGAGGG